MARKKPQVLKKKVVEAPKLPFEIDINQLLLHSRQLFLMGEVNEKRVNPLIAQIMALQLISDDPIVLWINSPGGYLTYGFSLIDTMRLSKVPIYTVIKGQACSMAGLISIAGHKRYMTENSIWMAHDIHSGVIDYGEKIKARAEQMLSEQGKVFEFLKGNTKLDRKDLKKAKYQELWLSPKECLDKGIVDMVFNTERVKQ